MKLIKLLYLASSIIVVILLYPVKTLSSPRWLRLSWTLKNSTGTSMTIAWNDSDPSGGTVEYRIIGGESVTIEAVPHDTGSSVLNITYEATLTGLIPSTTYEYRVHSGGGWSEWKVFSTPPSIGSCAPVRIVVGGDGRGGEAFYDPGYVSRHWDNIAGYIKNEMPNLMVYTGDIVHDGSEEQQWVEWFGISEFLTSEVPLMPVIGNHDDGPGDGDNQWYNKMYALPPCGAGQFPPEIDPDGNGIEDIWYIVIGNVLLIALSTEGVEPSIQHQFLEEVLSEWDGAVDWKFLFFHRPLWSSGLHGNNDGDMLDADNLIGIIDDYSIDFVICGHDHDYERFHPSKGGYGARPRIINPLPEEDGNSGVADGTIHIVSGGAGSFTNFLMSCRVEGCHVSSPNLNYIVFDITGATLHAVVRDLGPILTLAEAWMRPDPIDVFTVYKRSSICSSPPPDEIPENQEEIAEFVDNDNVAEFPLSDTTTLELTDELSSETVEASAEPTIEETVEVAEPPPTQTTKGCSCFFAT